MTYPTPSVNGLILRCEPNNMSTHSELILVFPHIPQGGFLNEQDRAGWAMNRALYFYNEDNNSTIDNHSEKGRFYLYTESHAIIECKMGFTFYPFDTHKCKLRLSTATESKFLGRVILYPFWQKKSSVNSIDLLCLFFLCCLGKDYSLSQCFDVICRNLRQKLITILLPMRLDRSTWPSGNWKRRKSLVHGSVQALRRTYCLRVPEFICPMQRFHRPVGYSITGFEVAMTRVATPFLINTYLPSGLLTIISFIGFIIPVDKVTSYRFKNLW